MMTAQGTQFRDFALCMSNVLSNVQLYIMLTPSRPTKVYNSI